MSFARSITRSLLRSSGQRSSAALSATSQLGKLRYQSTASNIHAHLKTFLIYAPDKTTEGTLARRYEARVEHLTNVKPLIDSGIVRVGGMFVDPDHTPKEGEPLKAMGSVLMTKAESLEAARKFVESDVYYTAGVWDPERLSITPFYSVTPYP